MIVLGGVPRLHPVSAAVIVFDFDPYLHLGDGVVRWDVGGGRYSLFLYGANLGNSSRYSTGNVSSSGTPRYFVLAPRSVQAVVRAIF